MTKKELAKEAINQINEYLNAASIAFENHIFDIGINENCDSTFLNTLNNLEETWSLESIYCIFKDEMEGWAFVSSELYEAFKTAKKEAEKKSLEKLEAKCEMAYKNLITISIKAIELNKP